MSVERVWFPNAPSGSVAVRQRSQIAVHVNFLATSVFPVSSDDLYLRRYLGDPLQLDLNAGSYTPASGSETSEITYLRRYLGDVTLE